MKFANQLFTAVCLNRFKISLGDAVSHFQLTGVWAAAASSAPTPSYALSAPGLLQPRGDMRPGADPTGTEWVLCLFLGWLPFQSDQRVSQFTPSVQP